MFRTLSFILISQVLTSFAYAGEIDTKKLFLKPVMNDFRAVEDSLCFENNGFMESAGRNPYLKILASVADKEGSCQGMVAVASAVKTKVTFRPERPKMSPSKIKTQVRRSVYLHKNNCSAKVFIDGYSNLRELCEANQDNEFTLRRRSLQYNLSLAIKEILPESRTFFLEGQLEDKAKSSKHILKELQSFYNDLLKGEYPLMLVRTHVTLVTGMSVERDLEGHVSRVTLHHYDPNIIMSSQNDIYDRSYDFSKDGKSIDGQLIWNISPRSTKIGCLFK
ncbi:MAG TPA: hypothetical protein VNJ08_05985 [Bacteriovoracaceae bacterium]|nr:hypothetical protein [Bacteriovoracaceae bacterium]